MVSVQLMRHFIDWTGQVLMCGVVYSCVAKSCSSLVKGPCQGIEVGRKRINLQRAETEGVGRIYDIYFHVSLTGKA